MNIVHEESSSSHVHCSPQPEITATCDPSQGTAGETATALPDPPDMLPGIFPHHLRELRASGLTNETITAAGIYSESNYQKLAAILGWKSFPKRMAPCMVFPFRDSEGRESYVRLKPDHPRIMNGKPVKYESPKGRGNEIYLPPSVAEKLAGSGRLLITEGEKKSLAATQAGFATIGLIGAFGWKNAKSESLLPALSRVNWTGRPVYLAFDSDISTNENVQQAETRLAIHLENAGAAVKCVRLPAGDGGQKVGLDDFLVAHGPAALERLLEEATEAGQLDPLEFKQLGKDADAGKEAASLLEGETLDGVSRLRYWRGDFLHWTAGRYVEPGPHEVRAAVIRHLNERFSHVKATVTSDVLDQLKGQSILSSRIEPPCWISKREGDPPGDGILATRNELVHLPSLVSGQRFSWPATPRFFTTSSLEFDFSLDAPEPIAWLKFLGQLWPDDRQAVELLQEWFGYCLLPDTSQQKIMLMVGPKRSGKGTLARVLRQLIGPGNCCGPTLASLAGGFGLQPLLHKTLAIVSDARLGARTDQTVITERLLAISGEDGITVDRKYLESVTAILRIRFMVLTNELPRLADASGALGSRMLLLRLTESFYGQEDHSLTAKLTAELPGILLWAIQGWQRLRDRGHFLQPDSGIDLREQLDELSSPVGAFVRECCELGPAYETPIQLIFNRWCVWCEEKGRREHGTHQTFGRDLRSVVPSLRDHRPRTGDESRVRCYLGIRLK